MARALEPVEIGGLPELVRLAEEVRAAGAPRLLRRGGEDLALLVPVENGAVGGPSGAKTEEDYQAFRSAAGGWKDVDTDKLIEDIYESRRRSIRPPVEL